MPAKKIICRQCGAELAPGTAECPYCGSAYAPEAERAYMRRLDDIREDLDDVGDTGIEVSRTEIRRTGRRTALIIGLILAAGAALFLLFGLFRNRENMDNRREYAWRQEHLQELDALFEAGDYDALIKAFEDARDQGHDLYDWEHYEFCTFWEETVAVDHTLAGLREGYFTETDAEDLLYMELRIRGFRERRNIPEADMRIMTERAQRYQNDLVEIFHATPEDLKMFDEMLAKHDGFPRYEECSRYVKDHPEILKQ